MKLEFLVEYHADLKPGIAVGAGPAGTRRIIDVVGGSFEGPKLRGAILPSGGDWLTVGADGAVRLDVRATFHTEDDAYIYVQYRGVNVPTDKSRAATSSSGRTDYGDAYFMTTPMFETGDPRYAWLNTVVAVAEGRIAPGAVEYRVYEVVNG